MMITFLNNKQNTPWTQDNLKAHDNLWTQDDLSISLIPTGVQLIKFLLIAALLWTFSYQSNAIIISANGSSNPNNISLTGTNIKQIQWQLVLEPSRFSQVSVRSQSGIFYDPSLKVPLGRVDTPIVKQKLAIKGQPTRFNIIERLRIPQSIVKKARLLGLNQIIFQRSFTDAPDNTSLAANTLFQLSSGSIAGQLNIERIQLEFENQRRSLIIPRGSQLNARAIIKYKGTGLFEYRWEIASPPSTGGNPIFFPLIVRKQYLLAGDQVTIQSPNLPSDLSGTYLLRLVVTKPETVIDLKTLGYRVKAQSLAADNRKTTTIALSRPQDNEILIKATEFAWLAIEGAKAYQLELYSRPPIASDIVLQRDDKPVTGVLLPANQNKISLANNSFAHLEKNQTYYWRVIAISEAGEIIGQSEFRRINF